MFVESRQRSASRHQFRLFGDLRDELAVASRPMLFHPEYRDSTSPTSETNPNPNPTPSPKPKPHPNPKNPNPKNPNPNPNPSPTASGDVKASSFDMFSPTSPSPTRTMIKEANEHLQLLHQRVVELEKTVQEQAEALIKKDESMQSKIRDVSDAKDAQIRELTASLDACEARIKKVEAQCRDKEMHVEYLTHKYGVVDELGAYSPILERLVSTLKKLPKSAKTSSGKRCNARANCKAKTPPSASASASVSEMDGHLAVPTQAMADMRIGRSFSINQNFSMSEDEGDEYS